VWLETYCGRARCQANGGTEGGRPGLLIEKSGINFLILFWRAFPIAKGKTKTTGRQLMPATRLDKYTCRWCGRILKTLQGLASHQTQAYACRRAKRDFENQKATQWATSRVIEREDSLEPQMDMDLNDFGVSDAGDNPQRPERSTGEEDSHSQHHSAAADRTDDGPAPPLNPSSSRYAVRQLDANSQPRVYRMGQTRWEELRSSEDPDNPFYPWKSQKEYELVEWLATSQLSQAAIDRFLKLNWVSNICNAQRQHC
jgi:hypothetical protein